MSHPYVHDGARYDEYHGSHSVERYVLQGQLFFYCIDCKVGQTIDTLEAGLGIGYRDEKGTLVVSPTLKDLAEAEPEVHA